MIVTICRLTIRKYCNRFLRLPYFNLFNRTLPANMDKLEKEFKAVESRINDIVKRLEEKKNQLEAMVPEELIINDETSTTLKKLSQAEKDLEAKIKERKDNPVEDSSVDAKLEKLTVADKEATPESSDKLSKGNKQEQQKGKQQKGGAKEPPAPDRPIDVSRLDLRVGKILDVSNHPDADSLYVEKIDCGDPTGPRTVISGLVKHVPIDEMKDRYVVVLCNLKPAKMRGILSEAMVMCASSEEKVEILRTPDNVKPGDRVIFDNFTGEPDAQLNPKKKIWEQVAPDIKTNDNGVAMYKDCEFKVAGIEGKFTSNLKNVQIR